MILSYLSIRSLFPRSTFNNKTIALFFWKPFLVFLTRRTDKCLQIFIFRYILQIFFFKTQKVFFCVKNFIFNWARNNYQIWICFIRSRKPYVNLRQRRKIIIYSNESGFRHMVALTSKSFMIWRTFFPLAPIIREWTRWSISTSSLILSV